MNEHWSEIEAEICLAETGGVTRRNGTAIFATVQTTEKQLKRASLVAKRVSGHASVPLRTNAIVHLSKALEAITMWEPPMRLNDTTRTYFEKPAVISSPEPAARYKALLDPKKSAAVREYLAVNEPARYSMLHTSISPTIIQGGFQVNVIPSEAEATLDIRALPDEDMDAFYEQMRKIINDPVVEVVPIPVNARPEATPSRIDSDAYHALEAAYKQVYGVVTMPVMSTGATDMMSLRAKGVQCYGVGVMFDEEDLAKGFGPHSDQERILEEAVYKHLQFFWEAVRSIALTKN